MRKPFALRNSVAAVAAVLAVASATAATRSPAPTGAPPANTAAPATSAPASGMPAAPGSSTVPANERNFVTMAASSGMLEVDASRLALERSKDAQVRTFAQRMVDDHSKANAELKMVAKKAGLGEVPSTMTATHNGHLERLRALSGQAFDREYAAQVGVAAHTEAVALFDRASKDLTHPELRAFAGATLPKLQDHLRQSQSLARSVGVSEDRMKAAGASPDPATSSTLGTTGTTGSDTTSTTGSGAGSTMGSPGATGSGTGGSASGAAGGSTPGAAPGSSGTGTGGGTGTDTPKSSTGR